ncbi:glycosyltransferase involved in cell wall biogenesis [Synechococcus sp. WH 7805]|nr:glycosyltransferase involved in cell wall biogenesis [Synechococcus sp. WH 7805]
MFIIFMKVSVITVVLNCADTISLTLDSVKSQDYPDVEHIIIDGGSKDGTVDIIKKSNVAHLTSEPDNGIYAAMEKGVSLALGDKLIFLNSGDTFFSPSTCRELAVFNKKTKADIIFGDFMPYVINESDTYDHPSFVPGRICSNESVHNKSCLKNRNIHHQALLYDRKVFNNCSFFVDEFPFGSDYIFNVQALVQHKFSAKYFPGVISKFALGGLSTSSFDDESKQLNKLIKYIQANFFNKPLEYDEKEYVFNYNETRSNNDHYIEQSIIEIMRRTDDIYNLCYQQISELKSEIHELKKDLQNRS